MPPTLISSDTTLAGGGGDTTHDINLPPDFEAGDLIVYWIGWDNDTSGGPGTFVVPPAEVTESISWDRIGQSAGLWFEIAADDDTGLPATRQWVHDAAARVAAVTAAFRDHEGANLAEGLQVTDPASPTTEGVSDGLTYHRWRSTPGPDVADVVPVADVRLPRLGLAGLHLGENAATPIAVPTGWTLVAHADQSATTNPDNHVLLAYAIDFGSTSGHSFTYSSGTAPGIGLTVINGPAAAGRWGVNIIV
jgi:hypothetical protein